MNRLLIESIRIARDYPDMKDKEIIDLAKKVVADENKINEKKTKSRKIKRYEFIT